MAEDDEISRKLHPRLRCLRNGGGPVNLLRSDISSIVATPANVTSESLDVPSGLDLNQFRQALSIGPTEAPARARGRLTKRQKLVEQKPADKSYVNVFIELHRSAAEGGGIAQSAVDRIKAVAREGEPMADGGRYFGADVLVRRNFVSATIPIASLPALENDPDVAFVHPSEPLTFDRPVDGADEKSGPPPRSVGRAPMRKAHKDGEGVIIGIIDVGGFDFAHTDFRDDADGTRFFSIWDQGGDFRPPPSKNGHSRFDYGSELTKTLMDAAIAGEKAGSFPATIAEQQSQQVEGSHATHVASIAAGEKGVCPKSVIAAVLISIPTASDPTEQRRATFSDSTRIVHAVEYLLEIAQRENKPISINVSLGTNGGAHDGSSGVSRWIDALLSSPGRSVCVAAGNAGQEKAQTDDDIGFIMGRIHSSGHVASRGLSIDMEWTVVGNGIEDMSENELEIWYGAEDRLTVMLKPPNPDADWITVHPREYVQNRRLASGTTVSLYNELYHPTNGCNYAAIYLSPNLQPGSLRGVQAGIWKLRLIGDEIRNGRYNCWIERDDPIDIGVKGGVRLFRFPSFFTEGSNIDSHSISSLACGFRVISVANLDDAKQRINISSSQGPTRDDRLKPDVAAAGTDINAAKGFSESKEIWIRKSGTSMASPYVAGVVGLMLATNPKLTSAQCLGILQRTARPLPGASYEWRNDAGFGVIEAEAAIDEALTFNQRTEVKGTS